MRVLNGLGQVSVGGGRGASSHLVRGGSLFGLEQVEIVSKLPDLAQAAAYAGGALWLANYRKTGAVVAGVGLAALAALKVRTLLG